MSPAAAIRRLLLVLGGLGLAAGLWLAGLAIAIWTYGGTDHAVKSDCAIVLGAAAYGAKPSPVFEERIRHGITLYRRGLVSKLIFTGGFGDGASHAEGEVGAAYAVREGVPLVDVFMEVKSRTTVENLKEAKTIMQAQKLDTAILVSDPLHLRRALWMARNLGIEAVTSPTPTTRYRSWKTRLRFLRRELHYWHVYLFTGE